jgi:DNA invertase Pin-like site-specific DNA recombinase
MAIVGYARVSTLDQVLHSQVDELTAAGASRIFTDHASGKLDARPGLAAALDYLRDHEGDVLMVTRIDRLGRSVQHLVRVVDDLKVRGVEFRSLHEGIDTTTAGGEMFFVIFAAIGQFSGRIISERTHEGLAAARARGRNGGRPRAMTSTKLTTALRMRSEGHTLDEIAGTIGVSASTVSRAVNAALLQQAANS